MSIENADEQPTIKWTGGEPPDGQPQEFAVPPSWAGSPPAPSPQVWGGVQPTQVVGGGYGPAPEADRTVLIRPKGSLALAWLVIASGRYAGHIFSLNTEGVVVGRDGRADIVLQDEAISGMHAKVWAEPGEEGRQVFVIQDLASANGTFVNGERVLKTTLMDGNRVEVGETTLVFKSLL